MPLTATATPEEEKSDAIPRHTASPAAKTKETETDHRRRAHDDRPNKLDSERHPHTKKSDSSNLHRDGVDSRKEAEHHHGHSHTQEGELIATGVDLAVRTLSHPKPTPPIVEATPANLPEVKKHSRTHSTGRIPKGNPWNSVDLLRKSPSDDPWAGIDPTKKDLGTASDGRAAGTPDK